MLVYLKDISKVSAGNSAPKKEDFSKDGIPFVRAGSLSFLVKGESLDLCEKISPKIAEDKKLKLFKKNAVVFAKSGMSAKMGRIYQLEKDSYVVSHLAILEANENKVNPSFLKYYFTFRPPFDLIRDEAYPSIKLEDIKSIKIDLPDLLTQNKIVSLLDKSFSLVKKREQSIKIYDSLLRARFLETFGDPVINNKNQEQKKLKEIAKIGTGATPSRKKADVYYGGKINWVKTTKIYGEPIFESDEKITDTAIKETNCKVYPSNSILLAMYGQGKTRGNVGLLKIDAATNQASAVIHSISDVNNFFLFYQLKLMYEYIRNLGRGGNQENLNLKIVQDISVLIPDNSLQKEFEKFYVKIEQLKNNSKNSLSKLIDLFNSILQRAFSGQINIDEEIALEALLDEIDLDKDKNDIRDIATVYLRELVDKINDRDFEDLIQYRKAKKVAFQLLESGDLAQRYNEKDKSVELIISQ